MGDQTWLRDPGALLVADASVVINLNATGCAQEILRALQMPVAVVDIVSRELDAGRRRGRQNTDILGNLIAVGLVEMVSLDDKAEKHFEQLVIGPAAMTLDDGEAATIGYAIEHGAIAVIDERKANRICSQRYPALRVGSTVDIFAHPNVVGTLGRKRLSQAVVKALRLARMRVLPHHVQWVIGLIGAEQAALCTSLPRSVRQSGGEFVEQER